MPFARVGVDQSVETGEIEDGAVKARHLSYGSSASAIGTRTLRNVNLPWALGAGFTVASGTLHTSGTLAAASGGTVRASRLILQSPVRQETSGGSVGLGTVRAAKLGYGATASAIGTRTLRNVNLPWALGQGFTVSAGTVQERGTQGLSVGTIRASKFLLQTPVRQEASGGSVGLGTVRAAKLGYGATASAIGTRTLRNVNLPWALGQGLTVASGTLQQIGTPSSSGGGTIRATRLILQSPVRQETSGGSVGLGTVRAVKLGYGATASAIGTRTLRNVNLPWALGQGLTVASGTLQQIGTPSATQVSGTYKQRHIGSYSIHPNAFDKRTWNLSETHPFWEGWLDRKSGARNTIPGGVGMGSYARFEYGAMGIASLTWSPAKSGTIVFGGPGTAWIKSADNNQNMRARGTHAAFTLYDAVPSRTADDHIYFYFGGSYNHNGGGSCYIMFSNANNGTIYLGNVNNGISATILGTMTKTLGVRRQLAALRSGGGSWVLMKGALPADKGLVVVGKATNTAVYGLANTVFSHGGAGSYLVHRLIQAGRGWN